MSNNPVLPPPNMDDFEATMIREENPLSQPDTSVQPYNPQPAQRPEAWSPAPKQLPRRAKQSRNDIWTYIALGAWFAVAGFIGAFLGTVLANIL